MISISDKKLIPLLNSESIRAKKEDVERARMEHDREVGKLESLTASKADERLDLISQSRTLGPAEMSELRNYIVGFLRGMLPSCYTIGYFGATTKSTWAAIYNKGAQAGLLECEINPTSKLIKILLKTNNETKIANNFREMELYLRQYFP